MEGLWKRSALRRLTKREGRRPRVARSNVSDLAPDASTLPRYGHERASPKCLLLRMSLEIARGILDAWGREVDDLVRSLPSCTNEQDRRRTVDQIERLIKAGELFARNIMAWYGEDRQRETGLRNRTVAVNSAALARRAPR